MYAGAGPISVAAPAGDLDSAGGGLRAGGGDGAVLHGVAGVAAVGSHPPDRGRAGGADGEPGADRDPVIGVVAAR